MTGIVFSIIDKQSNSFIGRISIRTTAESNVWNVGFWTHPENQNKGVMTEALQSVLKFGFDILNAFRIEAEYAEWNIASKKVLEKNGFQFVEFIEHGFMKKGQWISEHKVEIQKSDWLTFTAIF